MADGFCEVSETAEVMKFIVDSYLSKPFIPLFMPPNAFYAGGIGFKESDVSYVTGVGSVAEVVYSIVGFVSIDMVYLMFREIAVHIEPG